MIVSPSEDTVMGRRSGIRYFESKGGYFTNFEGSRYRLASGPDDAPKGPTYLAALEEFRKLMQVSTADTADQKNTVRVVVDLYGQHLERNGDPTEQHPPHWADRNHRRACESRPD